MSKGCEIKRTGEKHLVPALRFPEFRESASWDFVNGNNLFAPIVNKNHNSDLPILAITQDKGAVPRNLIDYNVIVSDNSIKSYKIVEVGDFIISLRSFQGGIEYSNYKGLCSPAYIVLRKISDTVYNDFYRHYLKSANYILELNRNIEGIRDGKMISYLQFSNIKLPFPFPEEQQKIAACLSSIDEEISAMKEKVEQLKTHKKGLMQKLFPVEGKYVPEVRFPEFRNDGEWEEKELHEIAKHETAKNKENCKYPVLTNSAIYGIVPQQDYFDRKIVTNDNLNNYQIVEYNDFVYNPRVSTESPVGPISRNKICMGIMSPLYTIFRFKEKNVDYFEYYFGTDVWHESIKKKANYGARFDRINISIDDFFSLPIQCPSPDERQKIAECFSYAEKLISLYESKVSLLERHKKGLMQQLFPKL
ncbi:restriction endonuclease subunit S [Bacteroides sp. AN502(2024)]|uniref:restriction endonuclease subunit S n=1 Tax=Bacteroides sp. AN502(2024) TaxID=3160599 RepID=UPI003512A5FA